MELQALLVLCGLGVAGVAVVLLMGLFSTSGTSYEEAIAQQRRATTELLALAESKNKPKKKEKKANKKLAKKEKKEAAVATGSEPEPESEAHGESGVEDEAAPKPHPHVEFSAAPVVVDVRRENPPNVKIRKRGKDPKVKPILVNKEDPSCVSDPSTPSPPPLNHFEELQPKDEFELLHASITHGGEKAQEKKQEEVVEKKEAAKPAKAAKGKAKQPAPAPEPAKEEPARERHNSGDDKPKEQRAGKAKKLEKKSLSEDSTDSPREELIPPLNVPQPSELTTDKLLKQVASTTSAPTASPPSGKKKNKKPEPNVLSLMAAGDGGVVNVGELVRVVKEAALSRTEIQILTDALLNKHHDPLPQHSEWTEGPNDPMQKLKKQLADKEKALADEIEASQALHAKLKELRTNLNAERTRAANVSRQAEQAAGGARAELHTLQARLQRLMEENHSLAQEKRVLQTKLGAEGEAQAQRVQMEMHIQRLSEAEAALVQQLQALQAEVAARVVEAGQARCEAGAAREAAIHAQQHANELATQLQEATHAYQELDSRMQQASVSEQRAQAELRAAQERLSSLADVQTEVQRVNARATTAEATAEKLKEELEKHKQEVEKVKQEAEKQKQQLQSEISSLAEQLALREAELAELKQMKVPAPAQNGLPPNTQTDQHKAAELAKVESVVEALRSELAAAARSSSEQRDQLTQLQQQLTTYQHKNNEAITKAQEAQYNEVASVLRGVCPSATPSAAAAAGKEWLQAFADNLKRELERRDAEKKQLEKLAAEKRVEKVEKVEKPDSRVAELAAQNEHLQGLVDKYKKIIDDTEGVLSRLQQNVSSEEARWAQQLADKQRELDDLRQRTLSQMQKKIDTLQEELQQAKAGNHNNSFADSERLTEERLMMAGLSNKSADLSNGPLQVGIEEK